MDKIKLQYTEGDKIGHLYYILEVTPKITISSVRTRPRRKALFLCFCGNTIETMIESVKGNKTKSCGCLQKNPTHIPPPAKIVHGHSVNKTKTSEYQTWLAMKSRCCSSNDSNFHNYGAKGIKICNEWINNFEQFFNDMGPKPTKKHSLERINNKEGYSKLNCKWATIYEQNRNKSNNVLVTYKEKTQCAMDWSKELNLSHSGFLSRLRIFKDFDRIFIPKKPAKVTNAI